MTTFLHQVRLPAVLRILARANSDPDVRCPPILSTLFSTLLVGETGASPSTGHVRHLALTVLQFFLVIPEIIFYDTVAHSSMHFPRKYEACKSKTETLRGENVFLELKVKTNSFCLFQIYILFIVIC